MKFSVILPIYNVELYLPECIDSILMQSYTDFELILVNDGSQDKSLSICNEYAKKDERIKVIDQVNAGLSMARNNGLAIATGDYVVFIDSDDFVISNDFLQKLVQKTVTNVDLIFFKYSRFIDGSNILCKCTYSYKNAILGNSMSDKLQRLVDDDAFYGMAWIKAVRRLVLVQNNIQFEKGLLSEDTEWNYHLLMHAKSIEFIDESFIAYRQRKGSISHSLKLKNLSDFIYIITKWVGPIKEIRDEALKLALLGSMAKYYSNLLVVFVRVEEIEKNKYKHLLKDLSWLLKFSRSKRPQMISKVYSLFGFDITIFLLNIFNKLRNEREEFTESIIHFFKHMEKG